MHATAPPSRCCDAKEVYGWERELLWLKGSNVVVVGNTLGAYGNGSGR
jgi:hypothetical protein